MKHAVPLLLAVLLLGAPPARSQTPVPIFTVEHPDGAYAVDVRQITALSMHRYVVDGVIEVDEMNIDTHGTSLVRFYVARRVQPAAPGGIGQGILDQAQEKIDQARERIEPARQLDRVVVKSYPATTHARTVEFRIADKDTLVNLHAAANAAWRRQAGALFKVE